MALHVQPQIGYFKSVMHSLISDDGVIRPDITEAGLSHLSTQIENELAHLYIVIAQSIDAKERLYELFVDNRIVSI
jgi:CO dehydrogenase nickel-insertion accessory protein CooC1